MPLTRFMSGHEMMLAFIYHHLSKVNCLKQTEGDL